MDMIEKQVNGGSVDSPMGPVSILSDGVAVVGVFFGPLPAGIGEGTDAVLEQARVEMEQYFAGQRKDFTVGLAPRGTDFQQRVWKALQRIPYGQTRTYAEIAAQVGNPKAARAVGMANNCNPIGIIIPCHRVIGADGTLTGYAGGLHFKQFLLDLERSHGGV